MDPESPKSGSEDFLRLWLRYEPRIYGMVFSLVPNWSDADDVMQEVSLVLWRRFGEFEPGSNFLAWAFTIVRYQVLAFRKRQRALRARLSSDTMEQIAGEVVGVLEHESCERLDALDHCLGRLRNQDREVLQLRYQPDATPESVAAALGKTRDAVYKALQRIHSRLLDCIERTLETGSGRLGFEGPRKD